MTCFKKILKYHQTLCQIEHTDPREVKKVIGKVCGENGIITEQAKAIFDGLQKHYHPSRMMRVIKAFDSQDGKNSGVTDCDKLKIALAIGSLCNCKTTKPYVYYKRKDIDSAFPYKIVFDRARGSVLLVPKKSSGNGQSSELRPGLVLHKEDKRWKAHTVQIIVEKGKTGTDNTLPPIPPAVLRRMSKYFVPRSPVVYAGQKERISFRRPYIPRTQEALSDLRKLAICNLVSKMVATLHRNKLYSGGLTEQSFLISWVPRGRPLISFDELPKITEDEEYTIPANVDFSEFGIMNQTSMAFRAPEVIEASLTDAPYNGIRSKEDDYALGCVLYYYCYYEFPQWFAESDPIAMLEAKKAFLLANINGGAEEALHNDARRSSNKPNSSGFMPHMRSIIYGLLHPDPRERMSASQAHSLLSKV